MDNLAHSLVGLAASKAGLEKLSPAATSICILAANAPDLDFVSALSGNRWTVLHYHRGVTHSIAGTLVLTLIIPAMFCLGDLLISRTRGRPRRLKFGRLFLAALIAGATHPLLDWTNNYGVRPFLPWNGKWFYGDLVFVIDPFIWLIFGGAAFLLTSQSKQRRALWALLGAVLTVLVVYAAASGRGLDHPGLVVSLWMAALIALVVCYSRDFARRYGPSVARAAFILMFVYLGGLGFLHSNALARAGGAATSLATKNHERVIKLAAMPILANPTHWRCIAETDQAVYRFDIYLTNSVDNTSDPVRYSKPNPAAANVISRTAQDRRAQMFFEFARFPVERLVGDCATQTLVQFADLRYTEPGKSRGNFSLELPVDCYGETLGTTNGR